MSLYHRRRLPLNGGDAQRVGTTYPALAPGDCLVLDDGAIELRVEIGGAYPIKTVEEIPAGGSRALELTRAHQADAGREPGRRRRHQLPLGSTTAITRPSTKA